MKCSCGAHPRREGRKTDARASRDADRSLDHLHPDPRPSDHLQISVYTENVLQGFSGGSVDLWIDEDALCPGRSNNHALIEC